MDSRPLPKRVIVQPDVKAGDLVLFGKYTSQEVKLEGEEYLVMLEDEVLAVIDDVGATRRT
jgi:chaperonin GroES